MKSRERLVWFHLNPSAKDLIESCGVPHVEVFGVDVNGEQRTLDYNVQNNDHLTVYPKECMEKIGSEDERRTPGNLPDRFIADVHLGKLARLLRMTGIDTAYSNHADDAEIAEIAVSENRAILTRDVGLLKHGKLHYGYWLRSTDPGRQVLEVIHYFDLSATINPFFRCINCNGLLTDVEKSEIVQQVPPRVKEEHDNFRKCSQCEKVYWRGTHYAQMLKRVSNIQEEIAKRK